MVFNTDYSPHVLDLVIFKQKTDVADEWNPIQQKNQWNHIHCQYTWLLL